MIELYGQTLSGILYHATLSWDSKFKFIFPRPSSQKIGIMGNIIRQSADKLVSTGTSQYSRLVPQGQADIICQMDFALNAVYLAFSNKVFLVEFDATIGEQISGGNKQVDIAFKIISQVI